MKTPKNILIALSFLTLSAGFALAGPSNPTASFTGSPRVSSATGCPMVRPVAQSILTTNPKGAVSSVQTVGYRHEGCTRNASSTLTCKPSQASCAAMRQS